MGSLELIRKNAHVDVLYIKRTVAHCVGRKRKTNEMGMFSTFAKTLNCRYGYRNNVKGD